MQAILILAIVGSLIGVWIAGGIVPTMLGVPTLAYLPYAFFNLLSPVVTVTFGFLGITIMKLEDDPSSPEYIGNKKSR